MHSVKYSLGFIFKIRCMNLGANLLMRNSMSAARLSVGVGLSPCRFVCRGAPVQERMHAFYPLWSLPGMLLTKTEKPRGIKIPMRETREQ